ncbi:isoprenoid synthase domain-containing protein [Crucibulum laeve]|uniref:Isoprenoid synthase domain-containing protein n=1 Tax=Crucibulum laeve TaxID=68775 RepID=A0A5C3LM71_9AGAR|nr:isoprenoid synthase domain-containing protein [Crucibulum laeve]
MTDEFHPSSAPPSTSIYHEGTMKPSFKSRFPCIRREDDFVSATSTRVCQYFAENWPWKSSTERDRFADQGIDMWPAFSFHDMPDDRLECVCLCSALAFLFDDMFESRSPDEMKQVFVRFEGLLMGTVLPASGDKFERVIFEISTLLRGNRKTDPFGLGEKYCEETLRWAKGSVRNQLSSKPHYSDLTEYLKDRFTDGGLWWTLSMLNWAYDTPIPQHLEDDPNIRELQIIFGSYSLLVNDIYSYRKELIEARMQGDNIENNLVSATPVAMRVWNCSADEAINHIESHIRWIEEHSFPEIEAKLKAGYTGNDLKFLEKYVERIKLIAGGNAVWSEWCGRYNRF